MTENEKNLVAQNIVKSVKDSEPLYRKWWVWVIGAAVVINLFGNTNNNESVKESLANSAPVVEPTEEQTWIGWYTDNESNWTMLTESLMSAEDCSALDPVEMLACVDQVFSEAIRYGNLLTPMPDSAAQATFDSWLYNVESARDDFRSGNYDSASTHLNLAVEDLNTLTSFMEAAQS